MRGVAAHRLLLLRLTDSRSANHMCAPPTSTSAPLSSAFTFPPPWLCPPLSSRAPRIPTVPPRVPVCLASALYTLCAKPSPMHPSGFVATACNKRDDMAIATAPARVHANEVNFLFTVCVLLARPTAPPSHLSIPFPPLLHRVLSARARASAHERRACARANTRNNAVDKHRTRAKLLRARARPITPASICCLHNVCPRRSYFHSPCHLVITATCARRQAATTIAQFSAWTRRD